MDCIQLYFSFYVISLSCPLLAFAMFVVVCDQGHTTFVIVLFHHNDSFSHQNWKAAFIACVDQAPAIAEYKINYYNCDSISLEMH